MSAPPDNLKTLDDMEELKMEPEIEVKIKELVAKVVRIEVVQDDCCQATVGDSHGTIHIVAWEKLADDLKVCHEGDCI